MKKLSLILFAILSNLPLFAQTVQVSGDCIVGTVTLTKIGERNGRNEYEGIGNVGEFPGVQIGVWWDASLNRWFCAYDGQPFFQCSSNTPKPPATSNPNHTWETTQEYFSACDTPAPISISGDVSLGVSFGNIVAQLRDEKLLVNWETLSESNNDHFEIQASQDGETFKTIATLKSKAANGNSETLLQYEWSAGVQGAFAAIPFVAFLMVSLTNIRRKRIVMASLMFLTIAAAGYSCTKSDGHSIDQKDGFIRIVQVDKDGTTSQSKVIKIVSE